MDSSVAVALITTVGTGVFGAVIGPIISTKLDPSKVKVKPPSPRPTPPSKGNDLGIFWKATLGGAIGVLLGYSLANLLVIPYVLSPCPFFKSNSITITSPTSESSVPSTVTVQGTACHISDGKQLWLLVVSDGDPGYYPQSGPIAISSDGKWSVIASIGSNQQTDVGVGFLLIPALVNAQGSTAIQIYLAKDPQENHSLTPLPGGIQLMNQELVIRK